MSNTIVWSPRGERQAKQLFQYLRENWTEKSVSDFEQRLTLVLQALQEYPLLGQKSHRREGVRGASLSDRFRLYYYYNKNKIVVLLIWDNRRNPNRLPY